MKSALKIAGVAALLLLLSACVPGSSSAAAQAASGGMIGKFILGLWHGVIAPVTLILELLNDLSPGLLPMKIHIYQVSAQGIAYDLGFYLGIAGSPVVVWSRRR
jgi:hypothetical protein